MTLVLREDSRRLKAAIHALAAQLGLDDETRWQLQQGLTGVASCRDMTVPQLRQVAARLREVARERGLDRHSGGSRNPDLAPGLRRGDPGLKRSGTGGRQRTGRDERRPEELATVEQTRTIEHLFRDLELRTASPPPGWRTALCRRIVGRPWPQTRADANKLLEALKAMRARGWRPSGGEAG